MLPSAFDIALSFPGEKRPFVSAVASALRQTLGEHSVFYDKFYEADLARPNLDILLQDIYHNRSRLIVVFLCSDYERKEWPNLEWRAVRDLLKKRHDDSIMPVRFDSTEIPGLFSIDGYISAEGREPDQIAQLIIERAGTIPTLLPHPVYPEALPPAPKHEIKRGALANALIAQCEENDLIIVKGQVSVGKTIFLSQFYRNNKDRSVAIFINGSIPDSYDLQSIKNSIAAQASYLSRLHLPVGYKLRSLDTEDPKEALSNLRKAVSSKDIVIFFILDGLDEIPGPEESVAKAIYDLLPISYPSTKVIASGKRALQYLRSNNRYTTGDFVVPAFDEHESIQYLNDIFPNQKDCTKLHAIAKGVPGYFASVRRLTRNPTALPPDLPSTLEKLLDVEWKQLEGDSFREQLVAFLCFDKRKHNFDSLAQLTKTRPEDVELALSSLSFINTEASIVFAADIFKSIAEKRLIHLRKQVLQRLIDFFLATPRSDESASHLPDLFNRAERYDDLVNYLDEAILPLAHSKPDPLPFLQIQSSLALKAAITHQRGEDALKYGLYRTTTNQLYSDSYWAAQLDALLSIGAFSAALKTARAASSVEDRLQSLSAIARHQKLSKGKVEADLLAEISQEYGLLDRAKLGRRAFDIASGLVPASPQLAIELLQYATEHTKNSTESDFEVARFSLGAQLTKSTDDFPTDAIDNLSKRISNPELRSIAYSVGRSTKNQSATEIIDEATSLSSDRERQFLLRIWAAENRTSAERGKVVKYAIQSALRSTEVTLTPGFFLDILSAAGGLEELPELLAIMDGQLPALEVSGPTLDVKHLQLRLSELEATVDPKRGQIRFNNTVSTLTSIDDLSTQAAALAKGIAIIVKNRGTSTGHLFEPRIDGLYRDLKACVSVILSKTADHFQVLKHCFEELAPVDFLTTCEFAAQFNTETRRDEAFCEIIVWSIVRRQKACDISLLTPWFYKISSPFSRDRTAMRVLSTLALGKKRKVAIYNVRELEPWIDSIRTSEDKAVACTHLALIVKSNGKITDNPDIERLLEIADELLANTPLCIEKINSLYSLTFSLSDVDQVRAANYLDHAEKLRTKMIVRTAASERCLYLNLKLTIRAFSGLIHRRVFTDLDYKEIITICDNIPGFYERVELLSELAVRFYLGECVSECRIVVRDYLSAILSSPNVNQLIRQELICNASPALYCSNQLGCLSQLDSLNETNRERAIENIVIFLLTRLVPGEAFSDSDNIHRHLDAPRIREILRLVEELNHDGTICYIFHNIVNFFCTTEGQKVARGDRDDIARKLLELVSKKLPNPRFIAHEGYKILGEGYHAALTLAKKPSWDTLVDRCGKLPNLSDRVFVMASLAELMSSRHPSESRRLIEESASLCAKIPVAYDRRDRLVVIARMAEPIDKFLSKRILRNVLGEFKGQMDDDRLEEIRRRAIDLAYQHDPKYAEELVSDLDRDPAKKPETIDRLKRQIKGLKLKSDIRADKRLSAELEIGMNEEVEQAYWQALKGLNAGSSPASLKTIYPSLSYLDERPLNDCYPIVSFAIESTVITYGKTAEAFTIGKRIYGMCLNSTKLVLDYVTRIKSDIYIDLENGKDRNESQTTIGPNDASSFKRVVSQWLAETEPKRVIIVDPEFTPASLKILRDFRGSAPSTSFLVLTGRRYSETSDQVADLRTLFRRAWEEHPPIQEGGPVTICLASLAASGDLPLSDRIILAEDSALVLTRSWNDVVVMGAEVSRVSGEAVVEMHQRIDSIAIRMEDSIGDALIDYLRFTL